LLLIAIIARAVSTRAGPSPQGLFASDGLEAVQDSGKTARPSQ
jgi:hypothetical protein